MCLVRKTHACVGPEVVGVAFCLENERSRLLGRRDEECSRKERLATPPDDLPFRCFEKLSLVSFLEVNMADVARRDGILRDAYH